MWVNIRNSVDCSDERGFLSKPFSESQIRSFRNIHIVSLEPGKVRGNHYHEYQIEYICVLAGRVRFIAIDGESGEMLDEILDGSRAPVAEIPARVTHALKNVGNETSYLLCCSDVAHVPDSDETVKDIILE